MNREQVIALAMQHTVGGLEFDDDGLIRFAALVAAQERETLAVHFDAQPHMEHFGREIADFIRARKEET